MPDVRSESYSTRWLNSGMALHGECWTLSSSEWPNAAAVRSLSDTLEEGGVPQRYSLTPKACAGILSRAERRGKSLPEPLGAMLRAVASSTTREQGAGSLGYEGEQSPTLTADWHNPAVMCIQTRDDVSPTIAARHDSSPCTDRGQAVVCVQDGQANGTVHGDGSAPTLNASHENPIVCVADDNANAAVDVDLCGSLKVGGGSP